VKKAENVEGRSFHADDRATSALAEVKCVAGRLEDARYVVPEEGLESGTRLFCRLRSWR
jgi:hypothetical protein